VAGPRTAPKDAAGARDQLARDVAAELADVALWLDGEIE